MMVSAVIFDMDGLLVDTEPLYQVSWQQAARELGYEIDDRLYASFVGRPTPACEAMLRETFGSAFPLSVFQRRWPSLWREAVDRGGVTVKPGVYEMLEYTSARHLAIAVATSSESEYAALTLARAGLAGWFSIIVSGEQVARGKPAPDIYLETARRLVVPPSDCVVFEDSEAGILAASQAGMCGVLVPHWPASATATGAARHVAPTLHEARDFLALLIHEQN